MTVFHAYDIRGIYPSEVNEELFYKIGLLLPRVLGARKFLVARDARKSSVKLSKAIIKALLETGVKVINIGLASTPQFYYAQKLLKTNASIMITASHNPPQYNGLKIMGKKGVAIGLNNGLRRIAEMIEKKEENPLKKIINERKKTINKQRNYTEKPIINDYYKFLISKAKKKHSIRIVIDNSNSPATTELKALQSTSKVIAVINKKPDGNFPGHNPNPLERESQKGIKELIKQKKADLGVIFDGDADRVLFFDEKAKLIPPDIITAILSMSYTKGIVVYDVRSSKAVPEFIKKRGLKPVLSKAGRSFMINKMIKEKAVLGGEKSGHYFFKEFNNKECTFIAVNKIMNIMESENKKLSELAKEVIKYYSIPEKNFKVRNPENVLKKIEQEYSKKAINIMRIDGLSIQLRNNSWFNIRQSNTEPGLLRLNMEAKNKEELNKLLSNIKKIIKNN